MNLIEIPKTAETWLNLAPINQINQFKVANCDCWRIFEGGAKDSRLNLFEGQSLQAPARSISTNFFYVLC